MSSAICFNLDQSKILSSGNGLNRVKQVMHKSPILTWFSNSLAYNLLTNSTFSRSDIVKACMISTKAPTVASMCASPVVKKRMKQAVFVKY